MRLDYITKIAPQPLHKYQYGLDKKVWHMSYHDIEHLVISTFIMQVVRPEVSREMVKKNIKQLVFEEAGC